MGRDIEIRPTVVVELADRRAFLGCFYHQGALGGVFVPGHLNLEAGTEVLLELVFVAEQRTMRSRGVVRWKRTRSAKNLDAGVGIEFLPHERRTRDLILDFANGRNIHVVQPRARRLPVRLTVQYATESIMLTDLTDDISEGGLFILSDELLPVGTRLNLKLKPPGQLFSIQVKGEVAWRQGEGRRGFGVRFQFEGERTKRRIEALVFKLRERVHREMEFRPTED
jgi:uncharacterized protein (TIGR02266 family)